MAKKKRKPRKKKWIQGAVKKPGQLHKDLGIKQGKKIPHSRLRAAAKGNSKTAQRARFALNMRKINRKKGRRKKK
jgi:hypothetical protein